MMDLLGTVHSFQLFLIMLTSQTWSHDSRALDLSVNIQPAKVSGREVQNH
jgi:hypothetical protein